VPRPKHARSRWKPYGRPAQVVPSRNVNGGYGRFQMPSLRNEASIPLDEIRSPRDTPIWKLEAVGLPVTGIVRSVKEVKSSIPMH
jgi:hypothetical protein